jgi:predicted RNA-binding protein with PIN domain
MIKKYIIDGNNLIGKISELWVLQQKDRQLSRVKLVKYLDQYFANKNVKVSLHLDGYAADPIPSSKVKINYSDNKTADSKIKKEIDNSKNPKVLLVVSSDHSVQNYAKVNSCTVLSSEDFNKMLKDKKSKKSEDDIAKSISNDEIKKIFGVD